MPSTNGLALAAGDMPAGYHEVLSWHITDEPEQFITLQMVSFLSLFVYGVIFVNLAVYVGRLPQQMRFGLTEVAIAVAGMLATYAAHELTHGWFMRMRGATPKHGVIWNKLMLYTTSPGFAYQRNDYLVITLAPLVFISSSMVLGMWLLQGTLWVALLGLCGMVNASSALGDIWIAAMILRYPRNTYIVDDRSGIRVNTPQS